MDSLLSFPAAMIVSRVTKISWKGPPLAVSGRSHFKMSPLCQSINCTPATPTESSDNKSFDALSTSTESLLHAINHGILVFVRLQKTKLLSIALRTISENPGSSSGKTSMETECSNTATVFVLEEF
ncbi:saccharopine dehydrogenase [Moniliophthora roreri]|nr:saccharopine dehydrogenase [Moniliophthora roreri]